jgi:hypothetical protein
LRSRGGEPRRVRIVPELRRMVEFRRLILSECLEPYGLRCVRNG